MFNAKLLNSTLLGGVIEEYTHVLTTEYLLIQRDDWYGYELSPQRGSLTPQTIDNSNTIFSVGYNSGVDTLFVYIVELEVDAVYLGAKSKNKVNRIPFDGRGTMYNFYLLSNGHADTDLIQVMIDANTTPQEVWISTTPHGQAKNEATFHFKEVA